MQTALQILHSSYTYLKIPKDYTHMWVQGIYQLTLFSWGQLRHHLLEITSPRYYLDKIPNLHFDFFIFKWCFLS